MSLTPAPVGRTMGPEVRHDDLSPASYKVSKQPGLVCAKAQPPQNPCVFGVHELKGETLDGKALRIWFSNHLAGAIYRIDYAGTNFVIPMPIVGGSFQWAFSYDIRGGYNEQYNPTEAGCGECDSFTAKTSSKQLELRAGPSAVYTRTQTAFFRRPGTFLVNKVTKKRDVPVLNKTLLSDIILEKRVEFVAPGVVDMTAQVEVPADKHYFSVASLACWVPLEAAGETWILLGSMWVTPRQTRDALYFVEQNLAGGIVLATKDGSKAFGVVMTEYPRGDPLFNSPSYRVSLNAPRKHMLWTISQRLGANTNYVTKLPGGKYGYKLRFLFGPVDTVKAKIQQM